jgi:glutathione S-transferase
MKLFTNKFAPNPRRVRMFLAEKSIDNVELVEISINDGENVQADYLAINPLGWLPSLQLDDGTMLCESTAICRYFEETVPEPPLMGSTPVEKAVIEQWSRHMEFEILAPVAFAFRNTNKFWEGRIPQAPAFGAISKELVEKRLDWLEGHMEGRDFIATDSYSYADLTALAGIDFGRVAKIRLQDNHVNLKRWHEAVSSRPSAKA